MTTIEAITFTTDQFLTLLGSLLSAIGVAIYIITRKITAVEKDIQRLEERLNRNPYLKVFEESELKHARRIVEVLSERLNIWEDEKKISTSKEGEGENKKT